MKFKFAASLLIVGSCMLSLAFFLPVEQMDTHVYGHSNPSNSIAYAIPGTAGVMARCTVPDQSIQAMKPDTEIVVKTSILGTCIDVGEIRCQNLVCSSEAQGIIDADQFIRGAMQYAYGDKYQSVGILSHENPGYLPQIRRWPNVRHVLSPERYSVRLPDQLVILDKEGKALTSRRCGATQGYCQGVPRRVPL
ncbi:hypothetical protein [Variovorax sp. OK605]|uniref:hypothetical protein n=1 Tax=Variovorax sp. OK605 TaxID=1855317 RepID=UPI00116023AA|nr:hypothetical protein [Variovorax sp. OK605]